MTARAVHVLGYRGRVMEVGAGERVVVILASMLVLGRTYRGTARELAARGFRVSIVEAPGCGGGERLRKPWGFEQYGEWMAEAMGDVGPGGVLVGHSNSGAAALVATVRRPSAVSHLVLVDTVGFDGDRTLGTVVAARAWDGMLEMGLTLRGFPHVAYNFFVHARNLGRQVGLAAEADMEGYATRVRVPTLAGWGRLDHTMPVACAGRIARLIPGARVYVSEKGSHDWIVTESAEFAGVVDGFVRTAGLPAAG